MRLVNPTLFPTGAALTVMGPRLELVDDRVWIFRLPRELRSQNATMWGRWGGQKREREAWEFEFSTAIGIFAMVASSNGWSNAVEREAFRQLIAHRERRRVQVTRVVPHIRNRLKDDGNLRSVDKHILDAMKHVGLIVDDRRAWIQHDTPRELVADRFLTVVELSRPDVRGAWRS